MRERWLCVDVCCTNMTIAVELQGQPETMAKSLNDRLQQLPHARRQRILAEADRLRAEYVALHAPHRAGTPSQATSGRRRASPNASGTSGPTARGNHGAGVGPHRS